MPTPVAAALPILHIMDAVADVLTAMDVIGGRIAEATPTLRVKPWWCMAPNWETIGGNDERETSRATNPS